MHRIKELALKLEARKCEYGKPKFEYSGHMITIEGVKPNPVKIEAIQNIKDLRTVKDVQFFLGLADY